jgi:AAA+ ATPase superfamily predicted ATPase
MSQNRPKIRVDREDEIAIFKKMLNAEINERIFLISAPSGIGKSELLREFAEHCTNDIKYVPVDFKGGSVNVAELLSKICAPFDKKLFYNFSNTLEKYQNSSIVNIQNNFMWGRNTINVVLNAIDDETLNLRQIALTEAFFADLKNFGKVLFVIDTFDDCTNPVTKAWITGDFLYRICHAPNVIVVIAGQEVPRITLEWENICYEHELRPIKKEYWYEYAKKIGASVPSNDSIDAIYDLLYGHSLGIAQAFERLYMPGKKSL